MRCVEWLQTDLPRDSVKQDLLYSLGASQTVCEISRNDAARRFEALALNGRDPGPAHSPTVPAQDIQNEEVSEANVDVAISARDQIERHIAANFTGHTFTQLIAAILRAHGYQTRVSPPGADKGVDIVASQGALGFDSPRLVVQVKSGDIVADQPTLQSLLGCVSDTNAEHGLLVSGQVLKAAFVSARTISISAFGFGVVRKYSMRYFQFTTSYRKIFELNFHCAGYGVW